MHCLYIISLRLNVYVEEVVTNNTVEHVDDFFLSGFCVLVVDYFGLVLRLD